jgi:hypothetical protein
MGQIEQLEREIDRILSGKAPTGLMPHEAMQTATQLIDFAMMDRRAWTSRQLQCVQLSSYYARKALIGD